MSKYLFIESRDPFASHDSCMFYDLARGQVEEGNEVTLFLVQNGVLPARKDSIYADRLAELAENGVTVLADEFSLRERAIRRVVDDVTPASVEELVDMMMVAGTKTLWH